MKQKERQAEKMVCKPLQRALVKGQKAQNNGALKIQGHVAALSTLCLGDVFG